MNTMPPAMVDRPASIATAVRLMLIGAGFSVLSLAYSLVTAGDYKDRIREELVKRDGASVTQAKVDSAFTAGLIFAVVFGLFLTALWVWMAWKNGAGRSWARRIATGLGAFNLVGAVSTLSRGDVGVLSGASTGISVVLAVATVYFLWRPESTKFFADSTAARTP